MHDVPCPDCPDGKREGAAITELVQPTRLLRVLGVAFGVAAVIGGTIGQGILRAPSLVAQGVPDVTWILALWALGGIIALIDAMSTVELAASIRLTGGPYSFAIRAFGPAVGLAVGASDWLANVASCAFVSVVFAEYLHRLGIAVSLPIAMLAAILPMAVCAVQWFGTRVAGTSQEIGSAVKALLFMLLIAILLLVPREAPLQTVDASHAVTIGGVLLAIRAIVGTYAGWNGAAYFCEEVRDPGRSIVRATFFATGLVIAIYLLINLAFLRVMTPDEMARSTLVAADAASRAMGPAADTVVTALSLISLVTIANSLGMMYPRVLFALARDIGSVGPLVRVASNGTPRAALIVTMVSSATLASVGVYEVLLSFNLSLFAALSVIVNAAAIQMRRAEPDLERPYRMPLFPLPALVALAINAALLVAFVLDDWRTALGAFASLAVVVIVLLALRGGNRATTE